MKIFLTGATGLIGRALCRALVARGDQVVALTRQPAPSPTGPRPPNPLPPPPSVELVRGDPSRRLDYSARVAGCDAIVHLAGASIGARRWTTARKREIRASRIDSTAALAAAIETCPADRRPRTFVVANGCDFYPFDVTDRAYAEDAAAGDTWLGRLCTEWEAAAQPAARHATRLVSMRCALVVARGAEAFERMAQPFRLRAGGPIGSGRQWFSWVHLDDVVHAYLRALDDPTVRGPVNLVAPQSTRQADFARALGAALHRASWAPVPGIALRAIVSELADYLLNGRRAVPAVLERAGFAFRYPDAASAIAACL